MRVLTKLVVWGGVSAFFLAALAAVAGSQVLPPGTDSDCAQQVPIVVAADEAAQSDLYSAATLAGVIDTTCIVLAGPRDGEMDADQIARLDAALAEPSIAGWVMGGEAAVPEAKVAGRNLKRLNGVDRWHTARLAGAIAADPDGDVVALTEATAPAEGELGGGSVIVDGAEVRLPPGLDADCAGQVPIVVAVDAAAQSDLYSAATLAGVLDTTCFVLAGARGEPMSAEQRARLAAAETSSGAGGWIVGGEAAVPADKISGYDFDRRGGEDRWATARLIGAAAVQQAAAATSTTTTTERVARRVSSGGGGSSRSAGGGSSVRRPSTGTPPVTVAPGTTSTTSTTEPMSTTTTTMPADTTTTTEPDPGDTTSTTTTTTEPTSTTTTTIPADTTTTTEPPAAASTFVPTITVEVPQLDGTTGGNIWADEEFEVTLARATGADDDCSLATSVTVTFTVAADGSVTDDGNVPATLVGQTAERVKCRYTVTFPPAPDDPAGGDFDWTMSPATTTTATLSDADLAAMSATGAYTVGDVTFAPNATITVPSGNDGAAFDVDFARSGGPASGCSEGATPGDPVTLTYTVPAGGTTPDADTTNLPLVAYPDGETEVCEYAVTFPSNENGAAMTLTRATTPSPDTMVTGTDPAASVTYTATPSASTFTPTISVTVPDLDGTTGDNIWADTTFAVTIARSAASMTTAGCDLAVPETLTYTVGDDGTVTTLDTLPATLAGTTVAGETCSYSVTYGPAPTDATDAHFSWEMTPPAADTLDAANTSADGPYTVGAVTFEPDATIGVPSGHTGKTFDVEFTATTAGCTDRTLTYTVGAGAAVALTTLDSPLVAYVAGAAASSELCDYSVAFPPSEQITSTLARQDVPAASTTVSGAAQAISASYGATFAPIVTVTVPPLDRTTAGTNIWADAEIEVTIARSAASMTTAGCDLAAPETLTYTVGDDGTVMPDATQLPARLIGTLADESICGYTVTFGDPPDDDSDADFTWTMTAPAAGALSAAQATAVGAYSVDAITFEPDATITVPTGHTGKAFHVDVASQAAGCTTTQTLIYDIGAGISVTADAGNVALVAYPTTATSSSDLCSYTVAFPQHEHGGGTTLARQDAPAASTMVTGAAQAIAASYGATFAPTVTVTVPDLDGTTSGVNLWTGATFEVTISRDATSTSTDGCSLAAEVMVTFTVGDTGAVTPDATEMPSRLIDTLADGTTNCGYEVAFGDAPTVASDTDFSWTLARGTSVAPLTALQPASSAYALDGAVTFEPDATIAVPAGHTGKTFDVAFTSVPPACTDRTPVTLTYAVADALATTAAADPNNPPLVAYPATAMSSSDVCSYTVAFPSNENGGTTLARQDAPAASTSVSGADQAISASYGTTFEPSVSVTVPDLDGTTGDNIWAATTFEVNIARNTASTSTDGCSLATSVDVTFTVADTGLVTPDVTEMPARLIGTLADGTTKCHYTATFPAAPVDTPGGDFDWTMMPASATEATLSDASMSTMSATRAYTVGAVTFQPDATITVPSGNDGAAFSVDFTSTDANCSGNPSAVTLAYVVANALATTAAPDPNNPPLIAYPATATSAADVCTYTAAFPTNEKDGTTLLLQTSPPPDTTATGIDQAISATYDFAPPPEPTAEGVFELVTEVVIDDRMSAEAGATLTYTFTPSSRDCWLESTETVVTINDEFPHQASPSFARYEIDGTTPCSYTLTWPTSEDGRWARWERYDRDAANMKVRYRGGYTETVEPCEVGMRRCVELTGLYRRAAVSRFVPYVSILVPEMPADEFVGATFEVEFAPAGSLAGCSGSVASPVSQTYVVQAGSNLAVATGTVELLVYDPDTSSGTDTCSYTATFPSSITVTHGDGSTTTLDSDSATTATVTDPTEVARSYSALESGVSRFTPIISVEVPQLDGVTSGTNIWTDQTFVVTIARTSGANMDCSLDASETLTYAVGATGTATTADTLPRLIGTLADGTTKCHYTATFPPAPTDTQGGDFDWTMMPASTTEATLSDTSMSTMSATRAYTVGAVTFQPDATITVPSGNDGAAFSVDFTSTDANCSGNPSAVTLTYTVPTGGTLAAADPANQSLVAYPTDATSAADVCSYTVTFSPNETGGMMTLTLDDTDPSLSTTVSGTQQAISATYVPALKGVSSGETFSCALQSDGAVFCWGDNGHDQIVVPSLTEGGSFTAVSVGRAHACALTAAGAIECWGADSDDQTTVPAWTGDARFTQVSVGLDHSCGLVSDGGIECWGANARTQTTLPPSEATTTFTQVSAGGENSCGLRVDQSVVCWGEDSFSSVVTDTPAGSFTSVSVGTLYVCGVKVDATLECWGDNDAGRATPPSGSFASVSAGVWHACGVKTDDTVACWGNSAFGLSPPPAGSFSDVSAGRWHSCALTPEGAAACWGYGDLGQASAPSGAFDAVSVGARHSCGITTAGVTRCWGDDTDGQTTEPAFEADESFTQLDAGTWHTCGVKNDSTVVCWGDDGPAGARDGRVGDAPSGATDLFTSVTAGGRHSCGIRSGDLLPGLVSCWGANNRGQGTPGQVLGADETFAAVSAGLDHTCALTSNMSVVCWGWNGPADVQDGRVSDTPSEATDLFTQLAVGDRHACAVRATDGTVECWGRNDEFQAEPPTDAFSALAAGSEHTCGIRSGGSDAGTVACWGFNSAGQADAPVGTFDALTAGRFHTCGIRADDATGGAAGDNVVCWGAGTAWHLITARLPS